MTDIISCFCTKVRYEIMTGRRYKSDFLNSIRKNIKFPSRKMYQSYHDIDITSQLRVFKWWIKTYVKTKNIAYFPSITLFYHFQYMKNNL